MPLELRPLLTIAVPTFNRADLLGRLITSIISQPPFGSSIELLICDNASDDGTPAVVRKFQESVPSIRYIRNESNIGPDRNFLKCFTEASGKYVWIMGDDDVVEPGGIPFLLSLLAEGYDLVHLKPRNFEGEYVAQPVPAKVPYRVFQSAEAFAKRVHASFTFISGNIVNKDRISESQHPPLESLVGTNLVQLAWTYAALANHRRSALLRAPIIAALSNNTGGYQITKVFGANLAPITRKWLPHSEVSNAILRGVLQKFLPYFMLKIRDKRNSSFLNENPHAILSPVFGENWRYWVFIYPLLKLPRGIAWIWFSAIRVFNKLDDAVGSPSLAI